MVVVVWIETLTYMRYTHTGGRGHDGAADGRLHRGVVGGAGHFVHGVFDGKRGRWWRRGGAEAEGIGCVGVECVE